MTHSYFHILEILMKLINDKRNDIYIHIDKKLVFGKDTLYLLIY